MKHPQNKKGLDGWRKPDMEKYMLTTEKTWLAVSIQHKPTGNETFISLFTEWLRVAHDL